MINIKKWLNGYVKIYIEGKEKERFINLCKNNSIALHSVKKENNKYTLCVDLDQYKNIKNIVRKTHIIPRIVDKCGLPFVYSKYKNRQSFVVGVLIGIFLFYVCSMYIWNISVEGEYYYTDSELVRFLKENNISTGTKIDNVDCGNIERLIRAKYSDIGWVSVRINGTHMEKNKK